MLYHVIWSDLGLVEYDAARGLMNALRDASAGGGVPGHVIFLEHPPTITLGYSLKGDEGRSAIRSSDAELRAEGVKVELVDRGGKATYHGPGQVICYLMLSLKELRLGVKRYVGKLMEVVLGSLRDLGVPAELDPAYPGVWIRGAKVAAVGIKVADGITTHGFAVNLDPDLAKFRHIVPCGIADRPVTSLAALGIGTADRGSLRARLLAHMEQELKIELSYKAPEKVWSGIKREAG
ncbi:MAG TPA: lipoyl(octanoyl) transferase LipB [bacterium]|nr:lipoyl(octanoyl) transferase LipB [bacterium]